MKTKKLIAIVTLFSAVFMAATADAQKKVLAISKVKLLPSIEAAATQEGKLSSLNRVSESIDGQSMNHLHDVGKFDFTARSDLDALLEEGALSGEAVEPGEADYLVVPSIDDFQDMLETATFSGIGKTAKKRKVRLGMVLKIYDLKNGNKIVATANFQLEKTFVEEQLKSVKDGDFSDQMLRQIADEMGAKIAHRVTDVIYPAEITGVTGKMAVINRGEGTGIVPDQVWEIFALGEEMTDSAGISLGRMEVPVGFMTITRVNVTPPVSYGIITEDYGVDKGCIARRVETE